MQRIVSYLVFCVLSFGLFEVAFAAAHISPNDALARLLEGNKRFMNDQSHCPNRNEDRRLSLTAKQRPFAIIVGCSDSRVPPELAFDQGLGDLFVIRVAGNVVGPTELDSVDYSAIVNNSSIIVVLGHETCGAVSAVLENNTQDIETVANLIKPSIKPNQTLLAAIEANIRHSVDTIKRSPPIAKLMKAKQLDVVGAYYDFNTGEVRILPTQ